MKHNEGFLGKHTQGGEHIYTEDHKPVILSGALKAGHAKIECGSVLVMDTDGINVIGANNSLPIIGVSDEAIDISDTQTYVSYIAHGTVKSEMLKGSDGSVFTDLEKLQISGVYAI